MYQAMGVGGVGAGVASAAKERTSGTAAARDASVDLKQAIKDYHDEQLTGLTDDEKAEIDRLCKEYLKKNPIRTDADKAIYAEYYKSLLSYYGFKGDLNKMAGEMLKAVDGDGGAVSGGQPGSGGLSGCVSQNTAGAGAGAGVGGFCEVIESPEGEKTLMVIAAGGRAMYLKLDA